MEQRLLDELENGRVILGWLTTANSLKHPQCLARRMNRLRLERNEPMHLNQRARPCSQSSGQGGSGYEEASDGNVG